MKHCHLLLRIFMLCCDNGKFIEAACKVLCIISFLMQPVNLKTFEEDCQIFTAEGMNGNC